MNSSFRTIVWALTASHAMSRPDYQPKDAANLADKMVEEFDARWSWDTDDAKWFERSDSTAPYRETFRVPGILGLHYRDCALVTKAGPTCTCEELEKQS